MRHRTNVLNARAKLESGAVRIERHKKYKAENCKVLIFPVAMRVGETPVPIPNTMVKTDAADNTWLETAREDRWLPDHGGLAQLGERLPCKQEVTSSNLVFSTRIQDVSTIE